MSAPSRGGWGQVDIDKATEQFLQQLGQKPPQNVVSPAPTSVIGGLPPHLLRRQSAMASAAASAAASAGTTMVTGRQTDRRAPENSRFAPAARAQAPGCPTQQQRLQVQPAQNAPRAPVYAPAPKKGSESGRALINSGWAQVDRPQPPKRDQPPKKQPRGAPSGGVRLSVHAYGNWSSFNPNGNEQTQTLTQPVIGTELAVATKEQKRWRPKHSYDLSEQDLPDSCCHSLNFEDDDSIRHSDCDTDVRGEMAGDLDLVPNVYSSGFHNKNMWNDYSDDDNSHKWRPTYCQLWIKETEARPWPVASFLQIHDMQHEHCDVQTSNGWLMAPVEYPETRINPEDEIKAGKGIAARRQEGNANLKIRANYSKLKRRVEEREGEQRLLSEEDASVSAAGVPQTTDTQQASPRGKGTAKPTTLVTHVESPQRPPDVIPGKVVWNSKWGKIVIEPRVIGHVDAKTFLKIPCFLRPAGEGDLAQMLDIYNWEVLNGIQALDTSALGLDDMKRVFKQCEESKTPIIVAVAGRGKQSQQTAGKTDKILGFSFVSIMSPGLAGDVNRSVGRFQGQVHVYVAHESRRNGIGRALLQKMTVFCSRYNIVSSEAFEWYDPVSTPRYDNVFYNPRSYSHIFIKVATRGKGGADTEWLTKFLDTENFFIVPMAMENSRMIGHCSRGQLLDTLVFKHDCQDVKKLKELS